MRAIAMRTMRPDARCAAPLARTPRATATPHTAARLTAARLTHRASHRAAQVECHPYYPQAALRAYCAAEGIVLQAYSSLGGQDAGAGKLAPLGGPLLRHPAVEAAAQSMGGDATAAHALLRWGLQRGAAVLPKSRSASRARENAAAVRAPPLDEGALAALDALDAGEAGRFAWRSDPLRMLEFE